MTQRASRFVYLCVCLGLGLGPGLTIGACGRSRDGSRTPVDTRAQPAAAAGEQAAAADEPTALLSEAAARALLAERFRAAGLRVLYDVPLSREGAVDVAFAVTVDGYDPERKIGFEYVAVVERGTDLDDRERALLDREREHRLLVVDATDAEGLRARIDQFLASLGP